MTCGINKMRKANNRRLVKVHLLSNPLMEADLDCFLQKVKISETLVMLRTKLSEKISNFSPLNLDGLF